jgi:hypothetical protein
VPGKQAAQLVEQCKLGAIHDRVVQVDSHRATELDALGCKFGELARSEAPLVAFGVRPVNRHRHLDQCRRGEPGFADVTGQHLEAELAEELAGRLRAPIPRWRERRLGAPRQSRLEQRASPDQIAPLCGTIARGAELALATQRFMAAVGESVLVQRQAATPGSATGLQRLRQVWSQCLWDHRQIERQAVARDEIQEGEQTLVTPPGVVVAQEELDRGRRRVERCTERIQPTVHASGPIATAR